MSNYEALQDYDQQIQKSKWDGIKTVIGGVCIHLFAGNLYLWGNIQNYVVTYYHFLGDSNAKLDIAIMIIPVSLTIQACLNPVGAYLQSRINPQKILITGSIIMLGAMLLASFQTTWWGFAFIYCTLFPAGIGLVYYTPIMCAWEWYPNNRGIITGIILAGFGFGAFFYGFISTAIVNPNNLKPLAQPGTTDKLFPIEVGNKVPEMFRQMMISWCALCIVSIILVKRNPKYVEEENKRRLAQAQQQILSVQDKQDDYIKKNYLTVSQGFRSFRFWHMGFMLLFGIFFGIYMTSVYKVTAQNYISDSNLTIAGALGSVSNGGSRIMWGHINDKIGFKKTYFLLLIIQLVTSLLIFNLRKNAFLYTIAVCASLLCEGGHFAIFPSACTKIFGFQEAGRIFTLMFFFVPFSSIVGFLIAQFGQEYISTQTVFAISSVLTGINIILLKLFDDQPIIK